ncbi:hypothetical protein P7K49_001943 [Saguinus oedipus]|uniref:Dopamine beta-hydroxylase n=1 Tax=Saguinus oedipus TaxID=9490 RepID=A0ABQ9WFY4_SAGOE|nr:hypothetical protein P7K49_001943 [Saguinus oedipus]
MQQAGNREPWFLVAEEGSTVGAQRHCLQAERDIEGVSGAPTQEHRDSGPASPALRAMDTELCRGTPSSAGEHRALPGNGFFPCRSAQLGSCDAWSDQNGQIHLDPQQDYQLLQVQRTPEGLVLLFKRPFGTCDPKDYLIEDGTVHLVYGILEKPFQSLEAINTSGLRMGLQRVQLLKPDIPNPALPSDTYTMEIHTPNIRIPSRETTYWCHVKELPKGFSRHHIVMYEPIVTKGNEGLVHHMEVFQCPPEMDSVPYFSGPCDSETKPDNLNYCRRVLAAWALGAKVCAPRPQGGISCLGLWHPPSPVSPASLSRRPQEGAPKGTHEATSRASPEVASSPL